MGTKLWNLSSDNLSSCAESSRNYVPSLEHFFEEPRQEADPANGIEENYKKVNDINFSWRALRLLRMKSTHFFSPNINFFDKTSVFLEDQMKKVYASRDNPSSASSEEIDNERVDGDVGANADDEMAEDEDVQERKRKSKQEIITKEHMLALAPKI